MAKEARVDPKASLVAREVKDLQEVAGTAAATTTLPIAQRAKKGWKVWDGRREPGVLASGLVSRMGSKRNECFIIRCVGGRVSEVSWKTAGRPWLRKERMS